MTPWKSCNPRTNAHIASVVAHRRALDALARDDGDPLVTWAEQSLALAEPDSPVSREARAFLGVGHITRGDYDQGLRISLDEVAATGTDGPLSQRAHLGLAWVRMARGELNHAYDAFARARLLGNNGGSVRGALWAMGWQARIALEFGALDEAEASAAAARELALSSGLTLCEPLAVWTLAEVSALRSQTREAQQIARSLSLPSDAYLVQRVPAALARASACLGEGPTAVAACFEELLGDATARTMTADVWGWQPRAVLALTHAGRLDEARALLRDMPSAQSPLTLARLELAEGVRVGMEDFAAAQQMFTTARSRARGVRGVLTAALADFAESVVLRRHGQRNGAREAARKASVAFANMGVCVYAEALGEDDIAPDALTKLTSQERSVARLVAQGLTNPQVAEALFLSVKTVQFHLTRVYAKLGVSGRTELAAQYGPELAPNE